MEINDNHHLIYGMHTVTEISKLKSLNMSLVFSHFIHDLPIFSILFVSSVYFYVQCFPAFICFSWWVLLHTC